MALLATVFSTRKSFLALPGIPGTAGSKGTDVFVVFLAGDTTDDTFEALKSMAQTWKDVPVEDWEGYWSDPKNKYRYWAFLKLDQAKHKAMGEWLKKPNLFGVDVVDNGSRKLVVGSAS